MSLIHKVQGPNKVGPIAAQRKAPYPPQAYNSSMN
jgi:hypothetical protein